MGVHAAATGVRIGALLLIAGSLAACRPAPAPVRSVDPGANVVVPYPVAGGGQIRFTVRPRYLVGGPIVVDLDLTAGSAAIRGPISARVFASDLEGERTVRALAGSELAAAEVASGQTRHLQFTWDGRDTTGAFVAAETYSLSLDFIVGGDSVRLGSVIEVRAP